MRALVTGGCGFIGSHIVEALVERGFEVVAYDSLQRSTRDSLEAVRRLGVACIAGDVRDYDRVKTVFERVRPDVVVHAAALISVPESFEKPIEYMSVNAGGTAVVAKLASRTNSLLIYLSSAAVYGNPVHLPIDEEHPLNPISPYGVSKAAAERIARLYTERLTVLRLFNVYGPRQNPRNAGVVYRFVHDALLYSRIVVYGDGMQTRDFIHVRDVANAVVIVAEKGVTGVFNIASGTATRIIDLANLVARLVGNVRVEHAPPRPGDIRESYASIERARRSLGWQPRVKLEDGVRELLEWLSSRLQLSR